MITGTRQRMPGGRSDEHTNGEKDKVFLIVLANTVVDPGTMMIHLANTTLADAAGRETNKHVTDGVPCTVIAKITSQPSTFLDRWG